MEPPGSPSLKGWAAFAAALVVLAAATGLALYLVHSRASAPPPRPGTLLAELTKHSNCTIRIYSPAFSNGSMIPRVYTCDGEGVSPPLVISGIPSSAKSLMLIVYDPDAPHGVFFHWVLYDIKPEPVLRIPEGVPGEPRIALGLQGVNGYGYIGYGPPCPPRGSTHHYVFLVLALNYKPKLQPGATPQEVLEAARGHIVACGVLYGLYGR